MIVAAYGLPGLTVLELSFMLRKLDVTYGIVRGNTFEKVTQGLSLETTPIVFDTAKSFKNTESKFSRSRVIALVVDNPYVLSKEYELPLLGAVMNKTQCEFNAFTESDLRVPLVTDYGDVPPFQIERKAFDPVPSILKSYNASALSAIQTQLYRIKDSETRDKVGRLVKGFFINRDSIDTLSHKLERVASKKVAGSFSTLLATTEMQTLRTVVQKSKANPAKMKTLAKKMKISPFDVKYLLSQKVK